MPDSVLNIAAYRFVALEGLPALREELHVACARLELKGTMLLAPEGINLFLAGSEMSIESLLSALRAKAPFENLAVKRSYSEQQPFGKLVVKVKQEIIPLGRPDIDPARHPAPRLTAQELKCWLDEGRDIVLFDTRNAFEVEHGTFHGARHLGLKNFRSFGARVREIGPELRDKPIVTFCTGGIRCEKAAPLLIHAGFREVYQLEGGILKYLEECGAAHFDGNCFVFDERIALDAELSPQD